MSTRRVLGPRKYARAKNEPGDQSEKNVDSSDSDKQSTKKKPSKSLLRRRSRGSDVEEVFVVESFDRDKILKQNKKKTSLNSPVRRNSIGDMDRDDGDYSIITRENDLVSKSKDSFEREVKNLLDEFSGISRVCLSDSKVKEVYTGSHKFRSDLPPSTYEEKLNFEEVTGNIPLVLITLRNLAWVVERIQRFRDLDFCGKWMTLTPGSLLDPDFALNQIRRLREHAETLMKLVPRTERFDSSRRASFCKMSKRDVDFDAVENRKAGEQTHEIIESVQRQMAKFVIATSALDPPMERLMDQPRELKTLEPDMKDRIFMLMEHLSEVIYRFYLDYFDCDRDGCGQNQETVLE